MLVGLVLSAVAGIALLGIAVEAAGGIKAFLNGGQWDPMVGGYQVAAGIAGMGATLFSVIIIAAVLGFCLLAMVLLALPAIHGLAHCIRANRLLDKGCPCYRRSAVRDAVIKLVTNGILLAICIAGWVDGGGYGIAVLASGPAAVAALEVAALVTLHRTAPERETAQGQPRL